MDQQVLVILAIVKVHKTPQRTLNCGPGLGTLNQVCMPNRPTPSAQSICGNICQHLYQITIRIQFDILLTAVGDVRKGKTDMPYLGEHQTVTEQSMRHQVCPSETCCTERSMRHHVCPSETCCTEQSMRHHVCPSETCCTERSMRHHVCPSETCCTVIAISTITVHMSRGRSNCAIQIM